MNIVWIHAQKFVHLHNKFWINIWSLVEKLILSHEWSEWIIAGYSKSCYWSVILMCICYLVWLWIEELVVKFILYSAIQLISHGKNFLIVLLGNWLLNYVVDIEMYPFESHAKQRLPVSLLKKWTRKLCPANGAKNSCLSWLLLNEEENKKLTLKIHKSILDFINHNKLNVCNNKPQWARIGKT